MLNIEKLVEEGYIVKDKCLKEGVGVGLISGEEYSIWISKCSQFLINNYPNNPLTEKFLGIAGTAYGSHVNVFEKMIGILKSFESININTDNNFENMLYLVLKNFHRMATCIKNRHKNRDTLIVKDEYDVQDLLEGVLRLIVNDVRHEEYTPSYAGGNSRVDFFLPDYKMYIETKMTRDNLLDKKIGEELLIDIGRYKQICDTLVCFIYDPDNRLSNPFGLAKDLENMSIDNLKVKIFICPE